MSSTICIKQNCQYLRAKWLYTKIRILIRPLFEYTVCIGKFNYVFNVWLVFSKFLLNINGQNAADFHLGTINVPFALQATSCLIALITKLIGDTSQLFSENQFCEKASVASDPGFQNKELNMCNFVLTELTKRSTVYGP